MCYSSVEPIHELNILRKNIIIDKTMAIWESWVVNFLISFFGNLWSKDTSQTLLSSLTYTNYLFLWLESYSYKPIQQCCTWDLNICWSYSQIVYILGTRLTFCPDGYSFLKVHYCVCRCIDPAVTLLDSSYEHVIMFLYMYTKPQLSSNGLPHKHKLDFTGSIPTI